LDAVTVVWGTGNEIMGDDAAGIVAARLIAERSLPWIRVFFCGTLPENYISTLEHGEIETLLILDAADLGEKPGTMRLLRSSEAAGASFSAHGIPIGLLLEPFEPRLRIRIIAIQPLSNRLGDGISLPVLAAAERAADAVCGRSWGKIPPLQRENLSPR